MRLSENRKPCRLGHLDCIGANSKDTRCFMDPSRCERSATGKRGRHLPDFDREVCARCGKELR